MLGLLAPEVGWVGIVLVVVSLFSLMRGPAGPMAALRSHGWPVGWLLIVHGIMLGIGIAWLLTLRLLAAVFGVAFFLLLARFGTNSGTSESAENSHGERR